MSTPSLYDLLPYSSKPSPERSLERLWWVSSLFGLDTALPKEAKVLDLGCSTGRNLIFLAEQYPNATFTGIDASLEQIAHANEFKDTVNLSNIRFVHSTFLQFSEQSIEYDYIFCHGVFSWINEEQKQQCLELI